jgi:hypothetical protein
MKKAASHKLIQTLEGKNPQAFLSRRTWAALLKRPVQFPNLINGRFGTASKLPDGSDSWNFGPMEDWPDLPAQGLISELNGFRYWMLPLWIVTRNPNNESRIGAQAGTPIMRNKLFVTTITQVPCLVAQLTSQNEWAGDGNPSWEAIEESEVEDNSNLPEEDRSGPVIVFRLAADQLTVREPSVYAKL